MTDGVHEILSWCRAKIRACWGAISQVSFNRKNADHTVGIVTTNRLP